jgi:hypothetical protein
LDFRASQGEPAFVEPNRRAIVLCAATSICSIALTSWILIVGLAEKPRTAQEVTFDELTRDLESGEVQEIRIEERTYSYRVRGSQKRTVGPLPTLASVRALRPTRPELLAPKVWFER